MRALSGLAFVALLGCAAPAALLNTPSGNPEVFIPNTESKAVLDYITNAKLGLGLSLKRRNEYELVVGKLTNDTMSSLAFGSPYDGTPEGRLKYTAVSVDGGVKLFGRAEMVTNPDSRFEKITDVTRGQGARLQKELETIKSHF